MQRYLFQTLGLLCLSLCFSASVVGQAPPPPPPGGGSTGGGYTPGGGGGGGTGNSNDIVGGSAVRDNAAGGVGADCGGCPAKEEPALGTKRSGAGEVMQEDAVCAIVPGGSADGVGGVSDSSSCCDSGAGSPDSPVKPGGCGSCGGGGPDGGSIAPGVASYTEHKATRKWAPWNRPTQSSFGPGVFSQYDSKVYFFPDSTSGLTAVVYDAEKGRSFNFVDGLDGDPLDGTMHDLRNTAYESLELKDVNDAVVTDVALANHVDLSYWGGFSESYEIVDLSTDPLNPEYAARLQSATDRNGNTLNIAYRDSLASGSGGFTTQELTDSPDRRWQIHQITDHLGDAFTYHYKSTQESGRWVVEKIDFPNSTDVDYSYTDGHLSTVDHPNGDTSTYVYGQDTAAQTATVVIDNAGGGPAHTMHLTNDYMTLDANGQSQVINQPQGVFRMSVSNADETVAMIVPDSGQAGVYDVYHGTGSASNVVYGVSQRYYADGWTPVLVEDSVSVSVAPDGTPEGEYAEVDPATTIDDFYQGTIPGETDESGREFTYNYDTDGFLTKKTFVADSTYEEYDYNGFKQLTRLRDRQGNVVQYEYDANGNLTKQKTGLKEVGGQDVAQPEYAELEWAYYPVGHANAGLLKTAYDAEWDGSSTDLHRTDYEYNARGLMTKMLKSASVTGGDRPETLWTYDADDRVATTTDPGGHQSDDTYNDRGQLIEKEYDDASAEQTLYGALGTPEEGLVVKTKDRRNVVTSYTYDSAGRTTQVTVGTAWDADILDGNADDTPITDRNEQSITTYTYLDGTELPIEVVRDGSKTEYVYDYRQRVIETKVYPYANKIMSSKVVYMDNKKFSDEDYYGRKKYYGYRASDGQLIRYVTGAYPSFSLADQTAVLNLVRDANLNPAYTIKDAITDENGRPETVIDERGTQFLTEYNAAGQVIRETKAVGTPVEAITEMDYDEDGNVIEIRSPRYFDSTDTNGYQKCKTVMAYDGQGRVLTRTEAPGTPQAATESYAYDSEGRQVTRTDARGKIWTTTYASCCGHSVSTKNPLGHGSIINKDNGGLVTHAAGVGDVDSHASLLNPEDVKTLKERTTRYDALGRVSTDCTWLVPQGAIDPNAPQIAGLDGIDEANGLTTQVLYDVDLTDGIGLDSAAGLTVTKAGGGTFSVSLSTAFSKLSQPQNQGGIGVSFSTAGEGNAVVIVNPENEMEFIISDGTEFIVATGKLEAPKNAPHCQDISDYKFMLLGSGTHDGQLLAEVTTVDANQHASSVRTDAIGNSFFQTTSGGIWSAAGVVTNSETTITDPLMAQHKRQHDALGRVTGIVTPSGATSHFVRNKVGTVVSNVSSSGLQTYHNFDASSRKTGSSIVGGGSTAINYTAGLVSEIVDLDNMATSYTYDDVAQLVSKSKFAGGGPGGQLQHSLVRDAIGRTVGRTHPDGTIETLVFDMASRLLSRTYKQSSRSHLSAMFFETFSYDKGCRLLSATSSLYQNTVEFEYDRFGRLASETLIIDGQLYQTSKTHDDNGLLTAYTLPDSSKCTKVYNSEGRLSSIEFLPASGGSPQTVASFQYDACGQEAQRFFGNGVVTSLTHTTDGQIASKNTPNVQELTLTRDSSGRLNGEQRTGVAANTSWTVPTGGFSALGWLQQRNYSSGVNVSTTRSAEGRFLTISDGSNVKVRTHGVAHQVQSITDQGSGVNSVITYDANGNLIDDGDGNTLEYGFRADVSKVVSSGPTYSTTESLRYDALGRIVAIETQANTLTSGVHVINLGKDRVATADSSTGLLKQKYFRGGSLDDFVAITESNSDHLLYLHNNASESLYAVTNQAGTSVTHFSYDSFGRRSVVANPGGMDLGDISIGFTGRFRLTAIPLLSFRSRFYLATLGVFCSPDRIGTSGGANEYANYFQNEGTDPYGFSPQDEITEKGTRTTTTEIQGKYSWRGGSPDFSYDGKGCKATWTLQFYTRQIETVEEHGVVLEENPAARALLEMQLKLMDMRLKTLSNTQRRYEDAAHGHTVRAAFLSANATALGVAAAIAYGTGNIPLGIILTHSATVAGAAAAVEGTMAVMAANKARAAAKQLAALQAERDRLATTDTRHWVAKTWKTKRINSGWGPSDPPDLRRVEQGVDKCYCTGEKEWDPSTLPPPPTQFEEPIIIRSVETFER